MILFSGLTMPASWTYSGQLGE